MGAASALQPTDEQQRILAAFGAGHDLTIEAGAGAGKTSTLRMLAADAPGRRGVYLAYNKAIATDAQRSFPPQVECRTAHSFAFRAIGRHYQHRLDAPRMPARVAAQILKVGPLRLDEATLLQPTAVTRLVLDTVSRFCHSADPQITGRHVPIRDGLNTPPALQVLREALVPLARAAWADLTSSDGRLKFGHDHYLKLWQLQGPRLDCDYVLLDEAQDADPCIAAIVGGQPHAQQILVGDRAQAIYGWRGAVDAMAGFPGRRLCLSQSFRFGPAVAAEANKWLQLLHAPLRLRGFGPVRSRLEPLASPDAVLCRTNAGAIGRVMSLTAAGRRVALVGGGHDIRRLAEAAITLKAGAGTDHPELLAFQTWGQLQDYVEQESSGSDLKVFVKLIDDHGPEAIIAAVSRLVDERAATVVVSTAHKAKGREWATVQVASDFREPKAKDGEPPPGLDPAEAMLAYVTVTRAKQVLDRGGLGWVDGWLPGPPAPAADRADRLGLADEVGEVRGGVGG
jgi:superfamily I DNA/RNA helicase